MDKEKIYQIIENMRRRIGYYSELEVPHRSELTLALRELEKVVLAQNSAQQNAVVSDGAGAHFCVMNITAHPDDSTSDVSPDLHFYKSERAARLDASVMVLGNLGNLTYVKDKQAIIDYLAKGNIDSALDTWNGAEKEDEGLDTFHMYPVDDSLEELSVVELEEVLKNSLRDAKERIK